MKSMICQIKNTDNTVINISSNHQSGIPASYLFANYAKVGFAIAGTVGTIALANIAGFLSSPWQSSDPAASNSLDKLYSLVSSQDIITLADHNLLVQPRHAKRAGFGGEFQINTAGLDAINEMISLFLLMGCTLGQIEIRQNKYLNNMIEQDHRGLKRITNPIMGFKAFYSAEATISGIEFYRMLKKEQHIESANMPAYEQNYALAA